MEMIKLQDNSQIKREHFTSPYSYFVVESVIEGNTLADVYVDQTKGSSITVVWDRNHSLNCGGSAAKEILLQAVEFIKQAILTQEVRQSSEIVKIACENNEWKEAVLEGMQELNPNVYPRSIYRHSLENVLVFKCKDNSIIIKKIDKEITDDCSLQNHEGLVDELAQMWESTDAFLAKGFGFCALKEDCIAAWCTGEYFSEAWCGIGIETYEKYQGQGIATAAAIELVKYCKAQDKIPHWDCWKNNVPSVKTAEKAGFEKLIDYDIVFLRLV